MSPKHSAFATPRRARRYILICAALATAALLLTIGLFTWGNAFALFSDKWWRVSSMRASAIIVIAVVALCHAFATVSFHTVTHNRIITPSIMGFESLFVLTQTSFVYFFGASSFASTNETVRFIGQILAMVGLAVTLYSTLLSGKHASMHTMLLTGIVIGTGFGALSTFMQRMLDPNEFDILRARLFGNIGNATTDFLWFVVPACFAACAALWWLSGPLNVIALGADTATNLGVAHRRYVMLTLTVVSFLMALTTSLIGPMTFLGFLTATLAYALTDTYDHRYIFPIAALAGYVLLGGAYFLLRHVFTMVDAVTIIVELIGGIVFLGVLLKKGRV